MDKHQSFSSEHLVYMFYFSCVQKDIRDIFTPIHFEVKYELGEHRVLQGDSGGLPSLKPILQQKDEDGNVVKNNVCFSLFLNLCFVIVDNFCGHFINLIVGHNVSWFEIFLCFCRPSLPDIAPGKTVRPTYRFLLIWFYHSKSSTYILCKVDGSLGNWREISVCYLIWFKWYKSYNCTYIS